MPSAIRSAFSASVALAAAGVLAVSPMAPAPEVHVPTVQIPSIELAAAAVPALGAIPYQILVNLVGDALALAPIVVGGIEQCTACLGPVGVPSLPFSGWGALGLGVGLLTSPFAFVDTIGSTGDIGQALGAAGLAIQTPITNTLALLGAPRIPFGGFQLQGTLDRAFIALKHTIDYTVNIAALALVTTPVALITGTVVGLQTLAGTLAVTGDFVAALNAGLVPIRTALTDSVTALAAEVQEGRTTVYTDLISGPGPATRPIPTVSASSSASVRAVRSVAKPRAAAAASAAPVADRPEAAAKGSKAPGSRTDRSARARSAG
jgi:hypothetical protein